MMDFPGALRYSTEHEWVAIDGTKARVGITDFAQDALGDVVYVSVPEIGATVAANAACGEVESTKSVSDVFTPVSGTVAEVNASLADTPELLNQAPYGDGWIFVLEMSAPEEVDTLMDAAAYRAFVDAS
jgi:glycine cleavage system H protein